MTNVADFIEDELGLEVTDEQRRIIDAMFPPPPPYVPPKQPWQRRAKRWFNRVILRRKVRGLSSFDRALKEHYGPGLAAQINSQSPLLARIKQDNGRAVWKVKP
jgi:hypothetical protein